MNFCSISPSPPKYLSIELAAIRPACIACIADAAPLVISPPAKTPFLFVSRVDSFTSILPFLSIVTPNFSAASDF